ncbi:MAG: hypothetical protein MHM6MM_001520 [Cercozoa sp. M6MM]
MGAMEQLHNDVLRMQTRSNKNKNRKWLRQWHINGIVAGLVVFIAWEMRYVALKVSRDPFEDTALLESTELGLLRHLHQEVGELAHTYAPFAREMLDLLRQQEAREQLRLQAETEEAEQPE